MTVSLTFTLYRRKKVVGATALLCSICIPHRTLAPLSFFFCSGVEQELHLVFCDTQVHTRVHSSCLERRDYWAEVTFFLPYLVDECMYVQVDILFVYFQGTCVFFTWNFVQIHLPLFQLSKFGVGSVSLYSCQVWFDSAIAETGQVVLVEIRIRSQIIQTS